METMPAPPEFNELELIALARGGDQAAYGRLVSHHQTLIVSLAYSICGDFARSQDIAQETFIAAWRQLGTLNEPSKFKSWLCGITRNLGHNFIRQQTRRPEHANASSETTLESASETPSPHEQAVTREEAAIVWQALAQMPENYREPLILFYREHQSVERVAAALDLSEETVKQRLSRGRGMLRAQMEHLVERSLGFTTPGALFTTAVLGALPVVAMPIAAASAAAIAVKGGTSKAVMSLSFFSFVMAPLISFTALFFGRWQALRLTHAPTDRTFLKRFYATLGTLIVLTFIGVFTRIWQLRSHRATGLPSWSMSAWISLTLAAFAIFAWWARRPFIQWARNFRPPENAPRWANPHCFQAYRSRFTLLGLPLIDIRLGHSPQKPLVRGAARGWIAIGDTAHGVILAIGGTAIGGIAIGVFAIGGLSLGALTAGLAAFGGVAVGAVASGVIGLGYIADGLLAVGFEIAEGGVAIACHFAEGPVFAIADHANDFAARHGIDMNPLMRLLKATEHLRTLSTGVLVPLLSVIVHNYLVRFPNNSARENQSNAPRPSDHGIKFTFAGLLLISLGLIGWLFAGAVTRESFAFTEQSNLNLSAADTAVTAATNEATRAQARYDLGQELVRAGRPPEALAQFLWCFDQGMVRMPRLAGIRRISVLTDIKNLGQIYPPALAALLQRRDQAHAAVLTSQATNGVIADLVALNQTLGEADRSLALYDQLAPTNELRPALGRQIFPQLLSVKRYQDAAQAEPIKTIFLQWSAMQLAETRRDPSAFSSSGLREIHDRRVQWLSDRIEALAGAEQPADARRLLALALAYDATAQARELYRTGLNRAEHSELLDSSLPTATQLH